MLISRNIVKTFQDRDGRWQLVGSEQHQQPTSERGNCAGKRGVTEQVTVYKKNQQNRWKNIEYLFFCSLHKMEQMLKQVVKQSEELYGVFRQLESESATRGEKTFLEIFCIVMIAFQLFQLQARQGKRRQCCQEPRH